MAETKRNINCKMFWLDQSKVLRALYDINKLRAQCKQGEVVTVKNGELVIVPTSPIKRLFNYILSQ